MTHQRAPLVFHGSVVMFVGMLCGLAALTEPVGDPVHIWRSAHFALLGCGLWLLTTAAVLPSLVLPDREASGLVWSLLATAYGLTLTFLVQGLTGVRGIEPAGPAANWIAFAGNVVVVLGALLATLLTMMGARSAVRNARGLTFP